MKNQYSCIIPVYNERPRVIGVLSVVSKMPQITKIICVDDGSTDGSYEEIHRRFPKITLLQHKQNQGKAQAIATGLEYVSRGCCILLDSDLLDVMPEDIKHSIQVFNENTIDCLLLCAQPVNSIDFLTRILFRLPHVVTGNRILKTEVLKDFFGKTSIHRYQFEFLLNSYLIHHRMRTAYIDITAKNVWKTQKNGVFRGIGDDARMWCQILSGVSPVEMFRQIFFFARRKM